MKDNNNVWDFKEFMFMSMPTLDRKTTMDV